MINRVLHLGKVVGEGGMTVASAPGLVAWNRMDMNVATTTGGDVQTMNTCGDQSGNSNVMVGAGANTQVSTPTPYTPVLLNGHQACHIESSEYASLLSVPFDSASFYWFAEMAIDLSQGLSDYTILCSILGGTGGDSFSNLNSLAIGMTRSTGAISLSANSGGVTALSANGVIATNTPQVIGARGDGTNVTLFVNGVAVTPPVGWTTQLGHTQIAELCLGSDAGHGWGGAPAWLNFTENVLGSGVLTDANVAAISADIAARWA